jgi:hypothetical protein
MSGAASDVRVLPECFSRQVVLVAATCAPGPACQRHTAEAVTAEDPRPCPGRVSVRNE